MVVKRLQVVIVALIALAACQPLALTSTSVNNSLSTHQTLSTAAAPVWIETETNGVTIGMWRHPGWESNTADGIVVAEHRVTENQEIVGGLLAYVFVPRLDESMLALVESAQGSYALAVLNAVVTNANPNTQISQPTHFTWSEHDAAYYLMSSSDGVRAIVLALTLPDTRQLVVFNVSAADRKAGLIRTYLPDIFNGVIVNGRTLDGDALTMLPDPLPFPQYNIAASPTQSEERVDNPYRTPTAEQGDSE